MSAALRRSCPIRVAGTPRASMSRAVITGDVRPFPLDGEAANEALREVPSGRFAVYITGVNDTASFARVPAGRADALAELPRGGSR